MGAMLTMTEPEAVHKQKLMAINAIVESDAELDRKVDAVQKTLCRGGLTYCAACGGPAIRRDPVWTECEWCGKEPSDG